MAQLGADVEQLEALARSMSSRSQQCQSAVAQVDAAVRSAWWQGPQADDFRRWWSGSGRRRVVVVADLLQSQSQHLTSQAATQRQTSETLDGGVGQPGTPGGTTDPGGILGDFFGAEFFNIFGHNEAFPLVPLGLAAGKMSRMARGILPIFQTGIIGRRLLPRLAGQAGRAGQFGTWMLSGSGMTFMRRLGIAGGVVRTGLGAYDLYQQGNPIDAFQREGAGYVADVASTAFSASTTAFLVAPNPVTGALAVGTGLVWAGAEVWDHYGDDITEFTSDAWDASTEFASDAWDAGSEFASDAWDAGTDFAEDVGGGLADAGGAIVDGVGGLFG